MPKINDMGYGEFNVVIGWPSEGALSLDFPYEGPIEYGDPVKIDPTTGKVVKASSATEQGFIGFALGGDLEPNVYGSGKITVLMSSFVADTKKYNTMAVFQPGDIITVEGGVIDKYDPSSSQVPIGIVLSVDTANQVLRFLFKGVKY